eukprot:TRINITY_DN1231_c0_g3_i2.p1 TRINITY_DN1231_c0_g3~~TRINITY_DN1231_c0_g3_i2.p1  ORF type:complete len:210 (+),score=-11.20 TRINITY_DN1231_c0_g3_i2:375-1004(+)
MSFQTIITSRLKYTFQCFVLNILFKNIYNFKIASYNIIQKYLYTAYSMTIRFLIISSVLQLMQCQLLQLQLDGFLILHMQTAKECINQCNAEIILTNQSKINEIWKMSEILADVNVLQFLQQGVFKINFNCNNKQCDPVKHKLEVKVGKELPPELFIEQVQESYNEINYIYQSSQVKSKILCRIVLIVEILITRCIRDIWICSFNKLNF